MESSSLTDDKYVPVSVAETLDGDYKELISTLPQTDHWLPPLKFHQYQSFWVSQFVIQRIISAQHHFKAKPTDIFLCSLPKSGTTWLKALCFSILRRTQFIDSTENPLLTQNPHDIVPFIEFTLQDSHVRMAHELPLWATHFPYASLPPSIIESNCKMIYICRNPKDVFISSMHFTARSLGVNIEEFPIEESFKKYCEGVSTQGPFWSHVLGYWKASLQFPDRILFIKYEDLLAHTYSYVKRLADFMGYPFAVEEEERGLVQKIVDLCGFQSLSNLEINKSKNRVTTLPFDTESNSFFRKGEIGDWRNYLTAAMAAQIDEIIDDKFKGSGLSFATPTP